MALTGIHHQTAIAHPRHAALQGSVSQGDLSANHLFVPTPRAARKPSLRLSTWWLQRFDAYRSVFHTIRPLSATDDLKVRFDAEWQRCRGESPADHAARR
jgi:hypothetical protein